MGTKSGARDGEEACEGSAWFYGSVVIVSSVTGPRSRALAERLVTPEEGPSPAFLTSPLLLRCPWGAAAALGRFTPCLALGGNAEQPRPPPALCPSVRPSVWGFATALTPLVGAKLSRPARFSWGHSLHLLAVLSELLPHPGVSHG